MIMVTGPSFRRSTSMPVFVLGLVLLMIFYGKLKWFPPGRYGMLPFFGKVHIGYIPNGKIVGLSKMPRLVKALASRLQVQERLTRQIAETLFEKLNPFGVAVIVEARHML